MLRELLTGLALTATASCASAAADFTFDSPAAAMTYAGASGLNQSVYHSISGISTVPDLNAVNTAISYTNNHTPAYTYINSATTFSYDYIDGTGQDVNQINAYLGTDATTGTPPRTTPPPSAISF